MFKASNLSCYDKSQQAQGKMPVCQYWHEEDALQEMSDIAYYDQNYLKQLMGGIDFVLRIFSKAEIQESSVLFEFNKAVRLYEIRPIAGSGGGGAVGSGKYGIKGDYASMYGITDMMHGIITTPAENNNIIIPAGIVLKAPGADTLTTIASENVHLTESTSDFTLFYADGYFLECGSVHYSEKEPEVNGVENYQAWFNPNVGLWQFRSNDTGNVWREAVATPLVDCIFTGSNITRLDFIGYRVLNKQEFVDVGDINAVLDAINGEII